MKLRSILITGLAISVIALNGCTKPTGEQTTFSQNASLDKQSNPITKNPILAKEEAQGSTCKLVETGFGSQGKVKIRAETVVQGLEVPWGIAFLPNRDMLVTERPGRVRLVRNQQLVPQPVANINISASSEGGLLGIAAHPNFSTNRQFYIYYTAEGSNSPVNRVERWVLAQDGLSSSRDRVIIDNIPVAQYHNGGRIRFGPDGMLYIGTGDARSPDTSQNPNSVAGKILRVTPEGEIPSDNPFPKSPAYITGIRNTQGFDWINASTLWVTDHGPSGELGRSGHDEASVARVGDNLGWPTIYGCEAQTGMVTPSIAWKQALPPGGAAIYTGSSIPEWQGSLIIASLRAEQLQRVIFNPQSPKQILGHEMYLQGEYGRLREVVMGLDGNLYVTTSNCDGRGNCPVQKDKILRITR